MQKLRVCRTRVCRFNRHELRAQKTLARVPAVPYRWPGYVGEYLLSEPPVTWAVVATVDEPLPLLKAFVAHYLSIGACQVHLCLDNPAQPVPGALRRVDGVFVHRCDLDWWHQAGHTKRPSKITRRQGINATHVSHLTDADFVLHCDADEFLRPGSGFLSQLQSLKGTGRWIKIPNLERAFVQDQPAQTIFDGVFKRFPVPDGAFACLEHPWLRHGFTGHGSGKAVVPTGFGYNFAIHAPVIGPVQARNVPPLRRATTAELLHFDGLTALHWCTKLMRLAARAERPLSHLSPTRQVQLPAIVACGPDPDALRALYAQMNTFTAARLADQVALGQVVTDRFDPRAAVAACFPGQDVKLDVARFDQLFLPKLAEWHDQARRNPDLAT